MTELELIIKRLNTDIGYDSEVIKAWLTTPHMHFNLASPMDFINQGLGYKVLSYIDDLKERLKDVKDV